MPRAGFEPARDCSRGILSPLRLPVSPPRQVSLLYEVGKLDSPWYSLSRIIPVTQPGHKSPLEHYVPAPSNLKIFGFRYSTT